MRTYKPITKTEISRFAFLSSNASYDFERKKEYQRLGRKILGYIAHQMGLKDGEFEIRWNPGGIAVSGDHTLHTDKVYLALHDNLGSGWFYYRSCNGRRDYSGGRNQIVRWESIKNGLEPLISALRIMHEGGYTEETGDFNMNKFMVERRALEVIQGKYFPVWPIAVDPQMAV